MGIKKIIREIVGTVKRVLGPLEPLADQVIAELKKAKLSDGRRLGEVIADEIAYYEADTTRTGQEKRDDLVRRYAPIVLQYAVNRGLAGLPDEWEDAAKHLTIQLVQSIFVGVRGQTSSILSQLVGLLVKRLL